MTVTGLTDAKYELAHTQQSILTHGSTRNFRTLVPWLFPLSSVTALAFSCSAVLTTFNQIITPECPQAAFWISPIFWFPVDRNIHWLAMVDPMAALPIPPGHGLVDANLIQWEKFCAWCSLKFLMKSSTSVQWYCSDVISDG